MKKYLILPLTVVMLAAGLPNAAFAAQQNDYSGENGVIYEAEDAILENNEVLTEFTDDAVGQGYAVEGYSGTGFVGEFNNTDADFSTLTFTIEIDKAGKYDLVFKTCCPYTHKKNDIAIDDGERQSEALATPQSNSFTTQVLEAEFTVGTHTVKIMENWGYFYVDALIVRLQTPKVGPLYARPELVTPDAADSAQRLMEYLCGIYGDYVLSGQYSEGYDAPEAAAIFAQTGKYPALMGFDLMYYTTLSEKRLTEPQHTIEKAIEWWNAGGIVTFCWHWYSPKDIMDTADNPWNRSFYKSATNFNFAKALSGDDPQGYDLMLKDIDMVAAQLKLLQDADVPVLWRPLHEAAGGWFWWGTQGSENYIALWNLIYDRLVNHHGLRNLIWVWNGQSNDTDEFNAWYPGDDTVDIIGLDIYPEKHDYSPQTEQFQQALTYTRTPKIIALTEVGVIPDPDLLVKEGAMWLWFAPWYREFTVDMQAPGRPYSDEYTGLNMLRKVYGHEKVITLDELPDTLNTNKTGLPAKLAPETETVQARPAPADNTGGLMGWIAAAVLAVMYAVTVFFMARKRKARQAAEEK
ncbi:MAG: glycosyl hydrolase [Christensenellales bacterium]